MYEASDTIIAVSSPSCDNRVIIRIAGQGAVDLLREIFEPAIKGSKQGLIHGKIVIDTDLQIDGIVYFFSAPHSYTGDDIAEIHFWANAAITEMVLAGLLGKGARLAEPGEFTARAYLNGKFDLTQAEAVNEIISSSNRLQLAASEKLLAGKLSRTIAQIRSAIIDCMSLIEAGLDFSEEDIEFISSRQAIDRLEKINEQLAELLGTSISYEAVAELPSVGIAGVPNAGKSSLLNRLLGRERSIVSSEMKTTRDVLSGELKLKRAQCVLFDCAGLLMQSDNIIDKLAQEAALEAIKKAAVVIFCVDISKRDWTEDAAIFNLINKQNIIAMATKADLLSAKDIEKQSAKLKGKFGFDFLGASSFTGNGLELLLNTIEQKIIDIYAGGANQGQGGISLTIRHKKAVTEAIENIKSAIRELSNNNTEVCSMFLRAASQSLGDIEHQPIDEEILQRIFSRFCIGK